MKSSILLFVLALPVTATAIETRWTATGTVTSVTPGGGLTATVGAPVTVKFSYDSEATVHQPTKVSFESKITYYGPVKLAMEVSIGENKWTASLPTSPPVAVIYAEAYINATDLLTVTASTSSNASFPLFPYTGSDSTRSVSVELKDNHSPSLFLAPNEFPDETSVVSSISSGSGEVKAGTDSIKFSIDPASVTVETGTKFKVTIEKTATGVTLRWPTIEGQLYLLNESDDCMDWDFIEAFTGTGAEQVHEIEDAFTEHPIRRFYQVVED